MTDADLLPCPFCGGEDQLTVDLIAGDDWSVECERCHVGQHAIWPSKYHAIAKWNTRTPSSTRANERGDDVKVDPWSLKKGDVVYIPVTINRVNQNYFDCDEGIDLTLFAKKMKHTPQPSPQSDMVAVPRKTLDKIMYFLKYLEGWQGKDGDAVVVEVAEDAIALLQPYTKGE